MISKLTHEILEEVVDVYFMNNMYVSIPRAANDSYAWSGACALLFYNPAKPSGRGGGNPPPAGRVTYWFCKAKA